MNQNLMLKCGVFSTTKPARSLPSISQDACAVEYEQTFDHLIQQASVPPLKQLIAVNSPALIPHSPNTSAHSTPKL